MKMKIPFWARQTILCLAVIGLASCTKTSGSSKSKGKGGMTNGPISVEVEQLTLKDLPRTVTVMALMVGRNQADVFPRVTGRVTAMAVREGDAVKAGDVLLRVDRSDPGESFLNAPVISPISGWVGRWIVSSVGEQVSPTQAAVTIVDDRELRATIFLPSDDWMAVTTATPVNGEIKAEKRAGKVLTVSRAADSGSGRGSVLVEFPNTDRTWRSGMIGKISFDLESRKRLLVASSSVAITDRGGFVYVIENDIAKRVTIKFRIVDSDTVEITEGLAEGAKIVTLGASLLSEGAAVHVMDGKKGPANESH